MIDEILGRIARFGPLRFSEYQAAALYGEGGFFSSGGGAGRDGADFHTSPEVGPLFGAVIARALDKWWAELGEPDPYVVVEAGAGAGTLAGTVLAANPSCAPALRYLLVESSEVLVARQPSAVRLEPAADVLGPLAGPGEEDGDGPMAERGVGPLCASLRDLPRGPFTGVILANELLDNLPVDLFERSPAGWAEIRVGTAGGALVEVTVPAEPADEARCTALAPAAEVGARIPLQGAAAAWIARAVATVHRGRVVAFDYGRQTSELAAAPMADWLRTYRGHARGGPALERPGTQDITCDVAVDQLRPTTDTSQAAWLAAHGLGALVDIARAEWEAAAAAPTLAALAARSRTAEAATLTTPKGLGAFRVLDWHIT